MTAEQAHRVRELFGRVESLPAEERPGFLAKACSDEAVVKEVLALLEAESRAGEFLQGTPEVNLPPFPEEPQKLAVGTRVGPYRLLRPLGSGGMSTVYLAVRSDDAYRRRVAIKVLRLSLAGSDARRRFETERQILASLEHPYIARLYDGGTTEEGLPFLAMEYVEGVPLDRHCEQEGLDLRQRLELFRKVCEAVQAAHGNLVVHRDLKPSNIFVTATGEPKLLDFGIAKLLNPELGPMDLAPTATWVRLLTPQYASPEQVRGASVTTATDIYSLGVLLFELLTHQRPFRLEGLTPGDLEQLLDSQAAPAPSSVVVDGSKGLPSAERLRRLLRGDLDNIVLKALRREPGRRYISAQQFSEDIARYLHGQPVRARVSTLRYRLGKFLRRNRWPVAASALVAVLLSGFTVLTALQAARIATERDQAQRAADKSERVLDLMKDVFKVADPELARGEPLTLQEALDRGAQRVEELEDQPEVRAGLLSALGEVYRNSGFYPRAEELLRQAERAWVELEGSRSPAAARSRTTLASVLRLRGQFAAAQALGEETLLLQRQLYPGDHSEVAETLHDLVLTLAERGQVEAARELAREGLAMNLRLFGSGNEREFDSLLVLAGLEHMSGDSAAARDLGRRALTLGTEVLGEGHPHVLLMANNLAVFLEATGQLGEAEEAHRRILALGRRVWGPDHPDVALSLQNLSSVLIKRESFQEAEEVLEQALEIQHRSLGADHPDIATSLNNLGMFYLTQRNPQKAEEFLRRGLDLRRRVLGEEHPKTAVILNNLSVALYHQGSFAEAERGHRQVLALRGRVLEAGHPDISLSRLNLGRALQELGRLDEAEAGYREALRELAESLGEQHPRVAGVRASLGSLLVATGRSSEGEALLRKALASHLESFGESHTQTAISRSRLGECLGKQGQLGEAETLLRSGLEALQERFGSDHPDSRRAAQRLTEFLQDRDLGGIS
ncbi:MAG: serine/threonine-protein kinase [Deltaproteobacteria bacterium]|nr:serine/threonine-protein kinase [Deltaproteobacteria bacterium]